MGSHLWLLAARPSPVVLEAGAYAALPSRVFPGSQICAYISPSLAGI